MAQTVNQLENKSLCSARNFRQIIYYKRLPIGCEVPGGCSPSAPPLTLPMGFLRNRTEVNNSNGSCPSSHFSIFFSFYSTPYDFHLHRWHGHCITNPFEFNCSNTLYSCFFSQKHSAQTQDRDPNRDISGGTFAAGQSRPVSRNERKTQPSAGINYHNQNLPYSFHL